MQKDFFILSPFELPDVTLAIETLKAGAFPFLHLGHNQEHAEKALQTLSETVSEPIGICLTQEICFEKLPSNVSKVIFPLGVKVPKYKKVDLLCQVYSVDDARLAVKSGITNVIVKGSEGAGKVAKETSFVLFQRIAAEFADKGINIYVQGGIGVHTSAAVLALGAKGVILDSQVALLPECSLSHEIKHLSAKLSGSETMLIDNFRVLSRNNSPALPSNAVYADILPFLGGTDIENNYLPMGQDICLSVDFKDNYKNLKELISALRASAFAHLTQAKKQRNIQPGNKLAKTLGLKYPIAQGPMARVSDVPEFAGNIADSGALPFIAMSLVRGEAASNLLNETENLMQGKTWGVGILGFAPPQVREEQTAYILKSKPSVVLIAGGRPSLAKPFEKEGIRVFLHVPSTALLDIFLKEKAKNFVFEGRESGGHIGPFSSWILWERQINRLLKEGDLSSINVFFAGGIHDAFSSAFVSIMSATLTAKGAGVGVLMGSSYIYTKEAVESGAILPEYQKLALLQDETVILEAAPGQETQCLKSDYTENFNNQKKSLQEKYKDTKEVWMRLEDSNIGRLRIAAKGIERIGPDLVKVPANKQKEKGLYMMGQISALNKKVLTLDELHTRIAIENNDLITILPDLPLPELEAQPLDVAIVGISGIFPDAKNIEEYWRNIVSGKNCVTEVPDSRWNKDLYYNPDTRDTDYVGSKWGGFIPTIDFDPLEFGMPPQSLASIEPTQLLSLLVAKQALADAGYINLAEVDLDNTSVIFGAEGATELAASYGFRAYSKQVFGDLPEEFKNSLPRLNEDSFAGVLSNVISGRIANRLNLGGRNYTVDAACASSLAALDLGCQELFTKRSEMVVLGGADLHNGINDFLMFSCTHALSRKGYSASFDANSDGIALGEGIGVLVLKRLEDAKRDGNKIYAVIKGVGGSSDGKSLGMTAPNRAGQMKALKRAYKTAGILPSQVGMLEAHGTGTVVGDRTELEALTDTFLESGAVKGQTLLGSVKTQIGHAKCAAGIAGVIKTALSLYYGVKPPIIHLDNPNPYYNDETNPFVFNTRSGIWNDDKRIAGVSAFGFGGTNFHVVMENYNNLPEETSTLPLWPSELFVFRGDSREEANILLQQIRSLLSYNDMLNIKNVAYSLANYSDKDIYISIIAVDIKDLSHKIDIALSGKDNPDIYYRNVREGKVAFMFSGQGSQRVNMARDLFVTFPIMRRLLKGYKEYEQILFPYAVFDDEKRKEQQKNITDTRNAQPLLGIVDLAIAEFLKSLGIVPDMVAGHSYGELPALCFAGAFSQNHLVELSRQRALSILNAVEDDKGKMLAVNIPVEELNNLLENEEEVWAVNFNSHKQTVLAGTSLGVTSFMKKLSEKNIAYKELQVACAFHSPLLKKSEKLFADVLKDVQFKKPSVLVWSNTTAESYPTEGKEIKERLAEHLVSPVYFTKEVENMYAAGAKIFIETGPGRVLTGLVQSILGNEVTTIETESKAKNGINFILHAIAQFISTGRSVNVSKLFESRNAVSVDIDNPSFYRKKDTIWYINGHNAVPANGKMPVNGAYPITQPIISLTNNNSNNYMSTPSSDQVVLEYLNSMKLMMQNQRDIMLSYLGNTVPTVVSNQIPVQTPQPRIEVQQTPNPIPVLSIDRPVVNVPAHTTNLKDIKSLLLDIVSEKTGYPVDMLGLDLDLEADLSIDSIKRMEIIGTLREKLNISGSLEDSEDAIEKMASVKTLNGLISWIEDLAKTNAGNTALPVQQVEPQGKIQPVTATSSSALSIEDIKTMLLDTVSEKTGYPVDMLGLDLDLEADLSIDSIKRMEIIGTLREKLNISGSLEDSEDAIEKMASVKTLNGLITWIEDLANGNAEMASDNKEKQVTKPEFLEKTEDLIRMTFNLNELPLDESANISIKNKRFALTQDKDEFSSAVKDVIEEYGAHVELINGDEDLSSYDGIIILNTSASRQLYDIKNVFQMIKKTNLENIQWIYTFSDLLGKIEAEDNLSDLKEIQGFPGLLKSLSHEYPKINFRAVVSHTQFEKESLGKIVIDELTTADKAYIEIIYKNEKRYSLTPKIDKLILNGHSKLSLNKDSVLIVFGGAQGITPKLMSELSKEYPCRYILVGRSEKPSEKFDKYKQLDSKDKIRKYLISEEQMRSPGEIEKKVQVIYKSNQINNSIEKIKESGAEVIYESLDIKDTEALRAFIRKIYDTYGAIDGIFHAAGLLDDKLFAHKTIDSFEQVYSTKVTPLHVLLDELRPGIKLFVMFSSVASAYGNRGQTDYASANSVFDMVASTLDKKWEARILTINWGPWKGAGMVSDTLEAEFKKRGVSLIPLDAGAKYFVNELKFGENNHVLVMGGADDSKSFIGV